MFLKMPPAFLVTCSVIWAAGQALPPRSLVSRMVNGSGRTARLCRLPTLVRMIAPRTVQGHPMILIEGVCVRTVYEGDFRYELRPGETARAQRQCVQAPPRRQPRLTPQPRPRAATLSPARTRQPSLVPNPVSYGREGGSSEVEEWRPQIRVPSSALCLCTRCRGTRSGALGE